jgi:hypothetical protein
MIGISVYTDDSRLADVSLDNETKKYVVSCKDEFGAKYVSTFDNLESAENFAEEWVLRK